VCFGDAAERYAELFQAGKVYDISKGTLTTVRNPKFSNHQYEIKLDHNSVVEAGPPRGARLNHLSPCRKCMVSAL